MSGEASGGEWGEAADAAGEAEDGAYLQDIFEQRAQPHRQRVRLLLQQRVTLLSAGQLNFHDLQVLPGGEDGQPSRRHGRRSRRDGGGPARGPRARSRHAHSPRREALCRGQHVLSPTTPRDSTSDRVRSYPSALAERGRADRRHVSTRGSHASHLLSCVLQIVL